MIEEDMIEEKMIREIGKESAVVRVDDKWEIVHYDIALQNTCEILNVERPNGFLDYCDVIWEQVRKLWPNHFVHWYVCEFRRSGNVTHKNPDIELMIPATAEDIKLGALIWISKPEGEHIFDLHIVDEVDAPVYYGNKGYVFEGNRHGLKWAYVFRGAW